MDNRDQHAGTEGKLHTKSKLILFSYMILLCVHLYRVNTLRYLFTQMRLEFCVTSDWCPHSLCDRLFFFSFVVIG